jgi:hypothetical protein
MQQQRSRLTAPLLQIFHIVHVEVSEQIPQGFIQLVVLDEMAIGGGGGGKPTGHRNALRGELLNHFPKGSILAAHLRHVRQTDLIQPQNECLCCLNRSGNHGSTPLAKFKGDHGKINAFFMIDKPTFLEVAVIASMPKILLG